MSISLDFLFSSSLPTTFCNEFVAYRSALSYRWKGIGPTSSSEQAIVSRHADAKPTRHIDPLYTLLHPYPPYYPPYCPVLSAALRRCLHVWQNLARYKIRAGLRTVQLSMNSGCMARRHWRWRCQTRVQLQLHCTSLRIFWQRHKTELFSRSFVSSNI